MSIGLFFVGGPFLYRTCSPTRLRPSSATTGVSGRACRMCHTPCPNRRSGTSSFRRKYPSGKMHHAPPRGPSAAIACSQLRRLPLERRLRHHDDAEHVLEQRPQEPHLVEPLGHDGRDRPRQDLAEEARVEPEGVVGDHQHRAERREPPSAPARPFGLGTARGTISFEAPVRRTGGRSGSQHHTHRSADRAKHVPEGDGRDLSGHPGADAERRHTPVGGSVRGHADQGEAERCTGR